MARKSVTVFFDDTAMGCEFEGEPNLFEYATVELRVQISSLRRGVPEGHDQVEER